jgi:hypothetical protein
VNLVEERIDFCSFRSFFSIRAVRVHSRLKREILPHAIRMNDKEGGVSSVFICVIGRRSIFDLVFEGAVSFAYDETLGFAPPCKINLHSPFRVVFAQGLALSGILLWN